MGGGNWGGYLAGGELEAEEVGPAVWTLGVMEFEQGRMH